MLKTAIATVINHEEDIKNQNYVITRNYFLSLVAMQFQKVSQISRDNARKSRIKVLGTDSVKFVTSYNPILRNVNSLIITPLPILHADLDPNLLRIAGGGQKVPRTSFFLPCNLYKRTKNIPKLSDVFSDYFATLVENFKVIPSASTKLLNLNQSTPQKIGFSAQILIKMSFQTLVKWPLLQYKLSDFVGDVFKKA